MPREAWSCPYCGNPGEPSPGRQLGNDISTSGMLVLLLLFIGFPVLLFLIHIFVPNM
jgi:hypothetical protein